MKTLKEKLASWVSKQNWLPKQEAIRSISPGFISVGLSSALASRRSLVNQVIAETRTKIKTKLPLIIFLFFSSLVVVFILPIAILPLLLLFAYVSLSLVVDIANIYFLEKGRSTTECVFIKII